MVDQVEKGELSYKQARQRDGIQGAGPRRCGFAMAARVGVRHHVGCPCQNRSKSLSAPAAPLTPEQKIKALKVQLREANEKARLFEAVLDALKKDDGMRLVKKPFGKSFRKSSSPD